jgi:hypothetical protein
MHRCPFAAYGTSIYLLYGLIRGGDGFGFLHLHFFITAGEFAHAGFGAERFGAAFGAAISFS